MANAKAPDDLAALFEAALRARDHAHAPYSRFAVGAAVRSASGAIFAGCNVENAAYPSGVCAETAAIAAMVCAGEREIADILVLGQGDEPLTPCGACRQVLHEFGPGIIMIMGNTNGAVRQMPIAELLPHAFGQDWVLPFIRRSHGGG
jgi:cytidine deaminase